MNESTKQTTASNLSGMAFAVSGMVLSRQYLSPGEWYWVTFDVTKTRYLFGAERSKHTSEETHHLRCVTVDGERGLFATEWGHTWAHYTRCVLAPAPEESKGFFKRFFGL